MESSTVKMTDLKDESKSKYHCNVCEAELVNERKLKYHIESLHGGAKNVKCNSCGKSFTKNVSLKYHIESVHQKIKHKCDICFTEFTRKSSLNNHLSTVQKKHQQCMSIMPQGIHREKQFKKPCRSNSRKTKKVQMSCLQYAFCC